MLDRTRECLVDALRAVLFAPVHRCEWKRRISIPSRRCRFWSSRSRTVQGIKVHLFEALKRQSRLQPKTFLKVLASILFKVYSFCLDLSVGDSLAENLRVSRFVVWTKILAILELVEFPLRTLQVRATQFGVWVGKWIKSFDSKLFLDQLLGRRKMITLLRRSKLFRKKDCWGPLRCWPKQFRGLEMITGS